MILPNICYAQTCTQYITSVSNLKIYILIIFVVTYLLIIFEELLKMRKSKITILSSTIMWIIIFFNSDNKIITNGSVKIFILEYCELFLFLFVAMVYINSIKHFGILDILKRYILLKNLSYKQIFWLTGIVTFVMSPIADNLTTAILMSSVILTIENKNKTFINLSFINIVIAANSGGVFSPFGDITTLMIWQNDILPFKSFLYTFLPSLITFVIPSIIMSKKIPQGKPINFCDLKNKLVFNIYSIGLIFLFILTIFFTVFLQTYLKLPAVIGMMTGFSFLQFFEYINNKYNKLLLNTFEQICQIEWETMLFFYGIILCIGALSTIGILNDISLFLYVKLSSYLVNPEFKALPANILIGLLSAIVDNIPITFAVINMHPQMSDGQWLLLTLTIGTGGSLLSIGSAAGIALMGQTNNIYTFNSHFRWSWIILIGYLCGIITHFVLNISLF